MSKRNNKIHALRMAVASINWQLDGMIILTEGERLELTKIAERLEDRAIKMGAHLILIQEGHLPDRRTKASARHAR